MTQKVKSVVQILLCNLIVLIVCTLLIELAFGDWIHENNLRKLNIIRNRKMTFEIGNLYPCSNETVIYSRDRFGFRGSYKNPSEITILTVGGSTTDQRFISDGQTWQDVIQMKFQGIGKNLVVANAGIDGQSTFGHIKNFEWWFQHVPDLKPKYILFYIGLNDFYKDEGCGYDSLEKEKKGHFYILKEKSAIYNLVRVLHGLYLTKKYEIGHGAIDLKKLEWTSTPLHPSYKKILNSRLKQYGERLETLIQKTLNIGAKPIFVTQPARKYRFKDGKIEGIKEIFDYDGTPVNGVDFYYMMKEFDQIAFSVAKKHQTLFIDLSKGMENELEDDDFYDFAHMTPKGTKKLGEFLFKILKEYI